MQPILDEQSVCPCSANEPGDRIGRCASVLKSLDLLGCPRSLRCTRDAASREVKNGLGLKFWCFDKGTDRDSGVLLATRLSRQPFIDGPDGLLGQAEGERVVSANINGELSCGAALAVLAGGLLVRLPCGLIPDDHSTQCTLGVLSEEGYEERPAHLFSLCDIKHVVDATEVIRQSLQASLTCGHDILQASESALRGLVFCPLATEQIDALNGNEPFFPQLVRHLFSLRSGLVAWSPNTAYKPGTKISWSVESTATLRHGKFGPMRDFPTGAYPPMRWSFHTKMTGGSGARMYFHPQRDVAGDKVLIGYCGDHLPTVIHPT